MTSKPSLPDTTIFKREAIALGSLGSELEQKDDDDKEEQDNKNLLKQQDNGQLTFPLLYPVKCITNTPCEYEDEVHLRIIVMAFNRHKSLQICLNSLQNLELGGDKAVLEIWLDKDTLTNTIDGDTLKTAEEFIWKHGPVRVNCQQSHVGIYGQWIDTWRPKVNTKEIALFLEDDVDISRHAYQWLKAVHAQFGVRNDVNGYSLNELDLINNDGNKITRLPREIAFMFRRFVSYGFSPNPVIWREFQDWFHYKRKYDSGFKPYVAEDFIITKWFKEFEAAKNQDSMWSIWFIFYTYSNNLYTVLPNIGSLFKTKGKKTVLKWTNITLCNHRRESGLHFIKTQDIRTNSNSVLVSHWNEQFINFPNKIPKVNLRGKVIGHIYLH